MRRLECRQRTNSDVWILFEFTTWLVSFPDFFIFLRHYSVIGKQLLFANKTNRLRWAVLGLSQDEDWIDLFENFSVNSLKGDLSNAITINPPLFSLVNSFKFGPNDNWVSQRSANTRTYLPPTSCPNPCCLFTQGCESESLLIRIWIHFSLNADPELDPAPAVY